MLAACIVRKALAMRTAEPLADPTPGRFHLKYRVLRSEISVPRALSRLPSTRH
jgi:hypothetical protein